MQKIILIKRDENMATTSFDNEIVLNDISAKALADKIEFDKRNNIVFEHIDIDKKLEKGRELLKKLFPIKN